MVNCFCSEFGVCATKAKGRTDNIQIEEPAILPRLRSDKKLK